MDDKKDLLNEFFFNGGWIILIIGACGMGARIIYGGIKYTIVEITLKIFAAMLCSGIAWFVLEQTDISSLTKAIFYGVIGVISPEVMAGIVKIATKFSKNPFKFLQDTKSD